MLYSIATTLVDDLICWAGCCCSAALLERAFNMRDDKVDNTRLLHVWCLFTSRLIGIDVILRCVWSSTRPRRCCTCLQTVIVDVSADEQMTHVRGLWFISCLYNKRCKILWSMHRCTIYSFATHSLSLSSAESDHDMRQCTSTQNACETSMT